MWISNRLSARAGIGRMWVERRFCWCSCIRRDSLVTRLSRCRTSDGGEKSHVAAHEARYAIPTVKITLWRINACQAGHFSRATEMRDGGERARPRSLVAACQRWRRRMRRSGVLLRAWGRRVPGGGSSPASAPRAPAGQKPTSWSTFLVVGRASSAVPGAEFLLGEAAGRSLPTHGLNGSPVHGSIT